MIIGVIYTAFNMADLVSTSLAPWVDAKRAALDGHTLKICAVSVPFDGFDHGDAADDGTQSLLATAKHWDQIDHAIIHGTPMREVDARGAALRWLVDAGCDTTIMVDADEIWQMGEISAVFAYVKDHHYVAPFRLCYRNLVFDTKHALAEPFTPMRIHRVRLSGVYQDYRAAGFWDDNNVYYQTANPINDNDAVRDIDLATMTVPPTVACPLHHSWLSNERSKRKIAYQLVGRGWPECSFRWNETTNQLAFNEDYYARRGLPLPEVITLP